MGDLLREYLPGLAAMPNWHPLVVHFPIALLTCFLLLDVAAALLRNQQWRATASGLLYLGTASACVAVVAGLLAAHSVPHSEAVHDIMQEHRNHGLAVAGLALLLSLWRLLQRGNASPFGRGVGLLLAAAMVTVMADGADLGGLMVYGYGVGVSHNHDQPGASETHSHDHGDDSAHGYDHDHDPTHDHDDHDADEQQLGPAAPGPTRAPAPTHEHTHGAGEAHHHHHH